MGYLFLCARLTAPLFYYRSSAGTPHPRKTLQPNDAPTWRVEMAGRMQRFPTVPPPESLWCKQRSGEHVEFPFKKKKKTIGAKANPNHWGALHQLELVCIGQISDLRSQTLKSRLANRSNTWDASVVFGKHDLSEPPYFVNFYKNMSQKGSTLPVAFTENVNLKCFQIL